MGLRPSKVAVKADEGRGKREDDKVVDISKSKREEKEKKMREERQRKIREGLQAQQLLSEAAAAAAEEMLENLMDKFAGVWTDDNNMQLEATTWFRKLLSIEHCSPIEEVIQTGVVPRFVKFLAREDFPQLQLEAAWALTNIAAGTSDDTKVVIDHGAVPLFVKLLGSPSDDVCEQAILALGNIAGDSPKCRDLVLSHGALLPLLAHILNKHAKLSMLRPATWTLLNFCRGKPPQSSFDQVKPALPALACLILLNDEEVLANACWALSYLSNNTNDKIQAVVETGVCGRLVELLRHPSSSVFIPALRTVGLIASGDDMHTQHIINHQPFPCLLKFLTNNYTEDAIKETCWTISNITAGNKDQIQAVIDAKLIGPLLHLLQNATLDIKKEAAWAVSNATCGGTHEQIKFLVKEGCIKPMCDLLVNADSRVGMVILEGINNILKVWEAEKKLDTYEAEKDYPKMIDDAKGLEKLLYLQCHHNKERCEKAVSIVEKYWWGPMRQGLSKMGEVSVST